MECSECNVRSSVGYCHECESLLCEVCSNRCDRCHKTFCRSHIQRTSSGRNICVSCVVANYDKRAKQSKELREKRATRAELGRKTRKVRAAEEKGFSFESLTRDEDPLPATNYLSEQEPSAPDRDFDTPPIIDTEALNARVLTGSASRRTPTWMSGLALALLSWGMVIAALRSSDVGAQRGILTLLALLLSLGTVVWTAPGAFAKEASQNRSRGRAALAVGSVALVYTAILLYLRSGSSG